jgi:hypothetical protein
MISLSEIFRPKISASAVLVLNFGNDSVILL